MSPSITEFVSYAMQKEGYLTEVASNGEDALEKIESDHFDLFILDIMLPGIDGYELCRLHPREDDHAHLVPFCT